MGVTIHLQVLGWSSKYCTDPSGIIANFSVVLDRGMAELTHLFWKRPILKLLPPNSSQRIEMSFYLRKRDFMIYNHSIWIWFIFFIVVIILRRKCLFTIRVGVDWKLAKKTQWTMDLLVGKGGGDYLSCPSITQIIANSYMNLAKTIPSRPYQWHSKSWEDMPSRAGSLVVMVSISCIQIYYGLLT